MEYSWQPGSHRFAASVDAPLVPVSAGRKTAGALLRLLSVATVSTLILQMAVGINMSSPFHPVWRQGVSQLFLLGSGSISECRGRQFTLYEVIFVSFKKRQNVHFFAN